MSGIRVNEWLHNSGTGGIWQTSAGNVGIASSVPTTKLEVTGDAKISGVSTAAAFMPSGGQLGNKNLVINGACNVAQRGTSDTSDAQGYTTVDRFKITWAGADAIVETHQESLSSSDTGPWAEGFRKAYKLINGNQTGGAGAGDQVIFETRLEAQDMATSGWNYTNTTSDITLSFWVKSSVSQTFYGVLETQDGTGQNYPYSFTASSTWTKVEKTIPGNANIQFDMDANNGIQIEFHPFMGTNFTDDSTALNTWATAASGTRHPDMTSTWWTTNDATFHITGLQLEVGSHATPFEHRSYAEDLTRCQRYFVVVGGTRTYHAARASNQSQFNFSPAIPVPLRNTPSLTTAGNWYAYDYDSQSVAYTGTPTVDTYQTDTFVSAYMGNLYAETGTNFTSDATTLTVRVETLKADAEL